MTDCTSFKPLIAGLIDEELTSDETVTLNRHLGRCASCRADYEELRIEMNKLDNVSFDEPADEALRKLWSLPFSRGAKNASILMVVGGYVGLILYGIFQWIMEDGVHGFQGFAMMAMVIGTIVLIIIALIERVISYDSDPYKDVER